MTTSVWSFGSDHLCCGSHGLIVLLQLLSSGPWPIDEKLRNHCQEVATQHRLQALRRCSGEQIDLRFFGTYEETLAMPGFFTGLSGIWLALLDDHSSWVAISKLISSGLCLLSDLSLFWLDSHAPWSHPMCLNRLVSAYLFQARQFDLLAWSCSGGGQGRSWWCQDPPDLLFNQLLGAIFVSTCSSINYQHFGLFDKGVGYRNPLKLCAGNDDFFALHARARVLVL